MSPTLSTSPHPRFVLLLAEDTLGSPFRRLVLATSTTLGTPRAKNTKRPMRNPCTLACKRSCRVPKPAALLLCSSNSHGLCANACHPADAVPRAPITPGRLATEQCLVDDMRSQSTANTAANTQDRALLCHLVTCTHTRSDGASTTFRLGHKRRLPDAIMGVRQHPKTSSNHITAATNSCATGPKRAPRRTAGHALAGARSARAGVGE